MGKLSGSVTFQLHHFLALSQSSGLKWEDRWSDGWSCCLAASLALPINQLQKGDISDGSHVYICVV